MNQQDPKRRSRSSVGIAEEPSSVVDYSQYYSRQAEAHGTDEPAFAPPVRLSPHMEKEDKETFSSYGESKNEDGANIYHRSVSASQSSPARESYQPEIVSSPPEKKKHKGWILPAVLAGVAVLAVLAWFFFFRDQPEEAPTETPVIEETVAVQETPQIVPYRSSGELSLSSKAQSAIAEIAPMLQFDKLLLSEQNVAAGCRRDHQLFDYYLFSADQGRLIAYFENVPEDGAFFQEDGLFYVRQSPYLLTSEGKAVLSSARLEALFGKNCILHPFYQGWAAVENPDTGEWCFVNQAGERYSNMEYAKVFPFSGVYTLAYLDTGNAGSERYLLYVLGTDGVTTRWKAADNMDEIVTAVNSMAVTSSGELYSLVNLSSPLLVSPSITFYPNFDAVVVEDATTHQYALYIHGKAYYSSEYLSIQPMSSDLPWKVSVWEENGVRVRVCALNPQLSTPPTACTFVLTSDVGNEYVSLSLTSRDPLLFSGELPNLTEVQP